MSAPVKEKVKKISTACNTCRLRRKKCDGLDPCGYCVQLQVECEYSTETKRRGPPSGYLRWTETRVILLETLLGLFLQTSPQSAQDLADGAKTLLKESTTRTQDVWDAYKQSWTDCEAANTVNDIANGFAPFNPADNHASTKSLLPPAPKVYPPLLMPLPEPEARPPSPFVAPPPAVYSNESFERHQPAYPSDSPHVHNAHPPPPQDLPAMNLSLPPDLPMPMFLPPPAADAATTSASLYSGAYWRTAALAVSSPPFDSVPLPLSPTLAGLVFPSSSGDTQSSPDLPPPHVRAALLATYRATVHPSLPILSPSQAGDPAALASSSMLLLALCAYTARLAPPTASASRIAADLWYESASALLQTALRRVIVGPETVQTLLLLALRDLGRGRDAIAWRGVGAAIRVGVELGLDGVRPTHTFSRSGTPGTQTPNGQGRDRDESTGATAPPLDPAWTRGLWGVATMLDLFLSIQLGRAPGSAEALRPVVLSGGGNLRGLDGRPAYTTNALPSPAPSSASASSSAALPLPSLLSITVPLQPNPSSTSPQDEAEAEGELFAYTRALVRIVARVHFCVGLGYADDTVSSPSHRPAKSVNVQLETLRTELAAWHRALPVRFMVALGGERVPRAVLEAHMLYQVGRGMLAPSSPTGGRGYRIADSYADASTGDDTEETEQDAASSFNVLLEKYRPSLLRAGPHVVWLVFAAARTVLQRAAEQKGDSGGAGLTTNARALQTQLYLLNCRDALTGMGATWEFARRCARALERLMESDGVGGSSGNGGSGGKRKRESTAEEDGARKRRDAVNGGGGGWSEQFDFGDAWAMGSEVEDGGAMGGAGLGTTWGGLLDGTWDEGLWGRDFEGFGASSGGAFELGLGLFDPPPGG